MAREIARTLFALATGGGERGGMLIAEIDEIEATRHPLAKHLLDAGFVRSGNGMQAAPPAR